MEVAKRDHEQRRYEGICQPDHPRDVPERAIEAEFATESKSLGTVGVELIGGNEQPYRYGEIESCAYLSDTGRRQVDSDALHRPLQATRQDRRTHPVPRLTNGGIREPDDCEAGQAIGDMDFH
jgi:hypothetical protein